MNNFLRLFFKCVLVLILTTQTTANDQKFVYSELALQQQILQLVLDREQEVLPEDFHDWSVRKKIEWLEAKVNKNAFSRDFNQPETFISQNYALQRLLFDEYYFSGVKDKAVEICNNFTVYPTDFLWRIRCLDSLSNIQPYEEIKFAYDQIIEATKELGEERALMFAHNELGWLQQSKGMVAEALSTYQYVLKNSPKKYKDYIYDANFNIATIYIIYGNKEYIKKGISLLEKFAEEHKELIKTASGLSLRDSHEFLELAYYNIGSAYTLHLNDYSKAIPYFKKVVEMEAVYLKDAKVFLALSYAKTNNIVQAQNLLEDTDLAPIKNTVVGSYLTCYQKLTQFHWDRDTDLNTCYQLPENTPAEARSDIYERLISINNPTIRTRGLELFYHYYESVIEPEFKERAARAASNSELKRLELETEVKSQLIEQEKQLKLAEKRQKEFQFWLFIIFLVFSGLVMWLIFTNLRRKSILANKLKELSDTKSRFFTNISHEFRTAVTLSVGSLKILLRENLINNSEEKQLVESALHNNLHMMHLINQFLDVEKIESGKMQVQLEELNVADAITSCVSRFKTEMKQQKLELVADGLETKPTLYFDPDHFDKIMTNLITNAIKFSSENSKIELSLDSKSEDSSLIITIRDYGIGISNEELEHIFDRFYQGQSSSSIQKPGTGIGLALVRDLLKLHNGSIRVKSHGDKGAEFIITLKQGMTHYSREQQEQITKTTRENELISELITSTPVAAQIPLSENSADENEKTPVPDNVTFQNDSDNNEFDRNTVTDSNKEKSIQDTLLKPLVLIIEDNPEMQVLLKRILQPHYRISCEANGEQGLSAAIIQQPDLIISDIMMPVMDGLQLTHKLKSDNNTSHIPLILLSAKAAHEEQLEGLIEGANDYITKPFSHEELVARVANQMALKKRMAQKLYQNFIKAEETSELPQNYQTSDQKFITSIRQIVDKNMSEENFSVSQLAELMNISASKLLRQCKKWLDCSPTQFIKTRRLETARQLLLRGNVSVSEAAYAVGFISLSAFSRAYADYHGTPPSQDKNKSTTVSSPE
ncbi:hybrid sensor histidine kinase/response regulator transcription factor [Pleionea sediminis]|uniref:hybrid sensor histidine kinase/response regulator transcription factor n=1 Tax=Pleionea sediminis TaxID=2569479 RepID=UPI0011858FA6|nr:ATP-binding protein [Pleionea sediminis]